MMTTEREKLSEWVRNEPVQAVLATAAYARMQVQNGAPSHPDAWSDVHRNILA